MTSMKLNIFAALKRRGGIIRRGAIFGGNTVFSIRVVFSTKVHVVFTKLKFTVHMLRSNREIIKLTFD